MNHSPFLQQVITELTSRLRADVQIKQIHPEYGGSINDSYKLVTSQGVFFLKRNDARLFPDMFHAEAEGLKLIKKCCGLLVPEVLTCGTREDTAYLVLEYLDPGPMTKDFWTDFGRELAKLHQQTQSTYGLEYNNFIGSLPQVNGAFAGWHDFFIHQRLMPQVKKAVDTGRLTHELASRFEMIYKKLPELVPVDRPALLHGDLWSGNFMVHTTGKPAVFDPAIYFGHRETDIAMTELFGGFHSSLWKAYEEVYPLLPGWKERLGIHNLYPLLVHVNLFGVTYVRQIETILQEYT